MHSEALPGGERARGGRGRFEGPKQPGNPQNRARARLHVPHHGAAIGPASIVDCYADLLEMGYVAKARDFAVAIAKRSG